ncbi:MAG TPA: hypothetical protein VE992_03355, partial [Solirubrobacteraceae bacterium]|nr:hypothetical protein [Solirubrobacteraceae bacterium]
MSTETFTVPPAPAREPGRPAGESGKREPRLERIGRVPLTTGAVVVALLAMLGASVWLRTVALHFYYWIDEGISVGIASHPLSHIPSLMREDGSPPLYYLILHLWMAWRGHSEIATHELSLIFALLTIPVAYWAGASLF